jgi:nucleotide-binding universal stress UspA family protein
VSTPIERIVVTLDAASENRIAIDTAAQLAARAKAPLHGVFVEDEDLLHLAGLPFARQLTPGAGTGPLTTADLEADLRVAAGRARRDLLAAAKRHGVTGSFEIVRGASVSALAKVTERDLVVAGALTRPVAGHFRVDCRWWPSIAVAQGPFLLARHVWSAAGAVVMLLRDRSPASARLLGAAAQLVEAAGVLTVISPPATAASEGIEAWITEQLGRRAVRLQIEILPDEPVALRRRLAELECRLLAVEGGAGEGVVDRLRTLVERLACDILIVR